jgi:hypothetical protein
MANIFDRDYSQASITPQQRIEDIARKSRVPVNVLLSATELAGAKDDAERLRVAGAVADEFGPRIQAGEDIKALIREAAGSDDAARAAPPPLMVRLSASISRASGVSAAKAVSRTGKCSPH